MKWLDNGYKTIFDAVDAKTGRAEEFLFPPGKNYRIQNLDVMASWIKTYAKQGTGFTIIGDYDCDGVCATAGMYLLLRELGAADIHMRLPRRMSEGYGLSEKIVDEVSYGVIITVDNGIAAVDAVRKAKQKGLCVLVVDHHLPKMEGGYAVLPDADLIVDPHVEDTLIQKGAPVHSDFDGYCGAGLVYKLAQILIPGTLALAKIAAFSAIATVADVVPLIEDNRAIYRDGMQSILEHKVTAGLQGILDLLNSDNHISETDIGFKIAPIINAPGRLYDNGAEIALNAVLAEGQAKAAVMAEQLSQINEARKGKKDAAVRRAFGIIERDRLKGRNPIVVCDPETPEGIVGLVAGAISEELNVSSIVFTETGNGLKGSARAAGYDNIKDSLDRFNGLYPGILLKYGGHKAAAGLSIKKDGLQMFSDGMDRTMGPAQRPSDELRYDLEINEGQIIRTAQEIRRYGPFGQDNPPVIVQIRNFHAVPQNNSFYRELKKDSVKLAGAGCEAIGFSLMDRYREEGYPVSMDIVGTLGFRYFNGSCTAQVEIMDLKSAKAAKPQSPLNQSISDALRQFGLSS